MKELSTIQKREKLNIVMSVDAEGPGGAHHKYGIQSNETDLNGTPIF